MKSVIDLSRTIVIVFSEAVWVWYFAPGANGELFWKGSFLCEKYIVQKRAKFVFDI